MKLNKKLKLHQSIVPGHAIAAAVVDRDLNFALRTWKRKLKSSEILTQLKEKQEYNKPSRSKRENKRNAIYKQKMERLNEQ
jgi:ribosomal protein S21